MVLEIVCLSNNQPSQMPTKQQTCYIYLRSAHFLEPLILFFLSFWKRKFGIRWTARISSSLKKFVIPSFSAANEGEKRWAHQNYCSWLRLSLMVISKKYNRFGSTMAEWNTLTQNSESIKIYRSHVWNRTKSSVKANRSNWNQIIGCKISETECRHRYTQWFESILRTGEMASSATFDTIDCSHI